MSGTFNVVEFVKITTWDLAFLEFLQLCLDRIRALGTSDWKDVNVDGLGYKTSTP